MKTTPGKYNAELVINGETIDVKPLAPKELEQLVKYFKELK